LDRRRSVKRLEPRVVPGSHATSCWNFLAWECVAWRIQHPAGHQEDRVTAYMIMFSFAAAAAASLAALSGMAGPASLAGSDLAATAFALSGAFSVLTALSIDG
jgi:hypothetical protein